MPKPLTERQITRLPQGTHRCAAHLYISVRSGSRLWVCRFTMAGRARMMSLGSADVVSLDEALAAVAAARIKVRRDGIDVVAERRAERAGQRAEVAAARAAEPVPVRKNGRTFGEALDAAATA